MSFFTRPGESNGSMVSVSAPISTSLPSRKPWSGSATHSFFPSPSIIYQISSFFFFSLSSSFLYNTIFFLFSLLNYYFSLSILFFLIIVIIIISSNRLDFFMNLYVYIEVGNNNIIRGNLALRDFDSL